MSNEAGAVSPRLAADLLLAAPFALYVLWLTAFPMSGSLLGTRVAMDWFLWPHALGLLVCAQRAVNPYFLRLFVGGTLLTAACTLVYAPLADSHGETLLALLGIAAAPLLVQTLLLLKTTSRPILLSAVCLGAGNFGMLALTHLPLGDCVKLAFLSSALLSVLFVPRQPTVFLAEHEAVAYRYLPFIFLFQISSGLLYGLLLPFYYQTAWLPGSELVLYVVIAIVTARFLGRMRETMLVCGILFAIFAFVLLQMPSRAFAGNASVWSMMAAAGVIDVATLAYAFAFREQVRGMACCFATMLAGIASGSLMVGWISDNMLSTAALSSLALSAIALLFARPAQKKTTALPPASPELPPTSSEAAGPGLPEIAKHPFSTQEWRVLQAVAQYQTYREAASVLGITESSVKIYMQRMYKKTGTFRRQQLLDKVACSYGAPPPL